MYRVRWWLARLVAPVPIMRDHFPGEDGVFVYGVQDGMVWSIRSKRFRMKSTRRLNVREYGSGLSFDPAHFGPSESFTRFVGTT